MSISGACSVVVVISGTIIYALGKGVKPNIPKALELLKKACAGW